MTNHNNILVTVGKLVDCLLESPLYRFTALVISNRSSVVLPIHNLCYIRIQFGRLVAHHGYVVSLDTEQ